MITVFVAICLLHTTFGDCPDTWTVGIQNKQKCLKGFANETTWMGAELFCRSQARDDSGTLASVQNAFENMQMANIGQKTFEACLYWIGLHDFDETGNYSWTDGSDYVYHNWATDYPPYDTAGTAAYINLQSRNRWMATGDVAETNCFVCQQGVGHQTDIPAKCPDGWSYYVNSKNKCIKGFSDETSWLGAYSNCISIPNGNLVSIHDGFQNLDVTTIAQQTFAACYYWIGMEDIEGLGYMHWIDNSATDYVHWMKGFPPNDTTSASAYIKLEDQARWETTTNIAETNCYICEITV